MNPLEELPEPDEFDSVLIHLTPDKSFEKHCYVLGNGKPEEAPHSASEEDSHCVYTPLCVDSRGVFHALEAKPKCSGYNKDEKWLEENCEAVEARNVAGVGVAPEAFQQHDTEWFDEKSKVVWMEGLTVVQRYGAEDAGIANFTRRVMFAQHMINNAERYKYGRVSRLIIVLEHESVINRLTKTDARYEPFQKFFEAVIYPFKPMSLDESIASSSTDLKVSIVTGKLEDALQGKGLCFRRASLPPRYHTRFFALDDEYPRGSSKRYGLTVPVELNVPEDSLIFRKNLNLLMRSAGVNATVGDEPYPPLRKRALILTNYETKLRMTPIDNEYTFKMILRFGDREFFSVEEVDTNSLSFAQLYEKVSAAAFILAIHGPHLTYAMMAPPLAFMLELLPRAFYSYEYAAGGCSGLVSHFVKLKRSQDHPQLTEMGYDLKTVENCVAENYDCKVFYRDKSECGFGMEDYNFYLRDMTNFGYAQFRNFERDANESATAAATATAAS